MNHSSIYNRFHIYVSRYSWIHISPLLPVHYWENGCLRTRIFR